MLFKSKPRWGDNKHHTSTLEKGLAAQPVKGASATQHSNPVAGVDPREMKAEDPDTSLVQGRSQQRCSYQPQTGNHPNIHQQVKGQTVVYPQLETTEKDSQPITTRQEDESPTRREGRGQRQECTPSSSVLVGFWK